MRDEAYELWYEHFSGMIRLNPRWDSYDALMLQLLRSKVRPLKVLEIGFTRKKSMWSKDRCFTQQMDWLAENGYAKCLSVTSDEAALGKQYKHVMEFVPVEGAEIDLKNTEFYSGFEKLSDCDLYVIGEAAGNIYGWSYIKSGALVAVDPDSGFGNIPDAKKIHSGFMTIWRKN